MKIYFIFLFYQYLNKSGSNSNFHGNKDKMQFHWTLSTYMYTFYFWGIKMKNPTSLTQQALLRITNIGHQKEVTQSFSQYGK